MTGFVLNGYHPVSRGNVYQSLYGMPRVIEWATLKPCKYGHLGGRNKRGECIVCKRESSIRWNKKHNEYRRKYQNETRLEYIKEWQNNNPKATFRAKFKNHLWRKYKLTFETYNKMLIDQAGLCLLCNKSMRGSRDPVVDHIKGTMIVRGLLHNRCNSGLWGFEDEMFYKMALRYLAEFQR